MNILQEINGNLAIFREYNPQSSGIFDLPKRTDSLSIDISSFACETDLDRESYINYFGNLLYYKHQPVKDNEWSNVKDLYKIIEKISFGDSGVLDTGNFKSYLQEGYALIDCPGCISKLKFDSSGSDSEYLKASIDIEYNSFKILKDDNVILDKKIGTGDLIFSDFINFKKSDSDVYKYKKQIFDGAIISGSGINFLQEKPFYWDDVDLNSKFITPISYDDSVNDRLTGQINVSIFSGKTISGYAVLPNLIKDYNKISGDKILSDLSYLPIKEHSREIFLSLYSGLEAYEYQKENSNFIPRMQRAYDADEGIYKNRPSTYRIAKENTFLPAKDEKHILLFDIDLYGFSGEAPEECDAELNAYILDEGNFSEIVKNPIPLNLTVTDLKTELTGLIRNVNDILKEKDVISGYQLNTNVSYDNSFFKYNKKYPYEVIKMKVELTSPKKTCYNIPQFFVLKDQNLSNFNRLRSYSLQVKDLNNNKIITSGVFVSGIQEGFLVNLNAGKYEFILSGTEKKFVDNEIYQNISIDNLEVVPEDPSNNTDSEVGDNNGEVSYDCHPILIRLTNADDVYEGQITNPINAKNPYIRIYGFDTLNNDTATRASYYQLSLNENYINLIEPNYLFSGDKNSTYRIKMRSICSECQPIQMTINNGNTIYSGNIPEYITAKNKVMYISGYNFGGGTIQPNSYELYVNGNIISLNSPSYVLTGSLNKNYKIKMRGVCNIQESSASLNSSSSSSSSRNSVSSSSSRNSVSSSSSRNSVSSSSSISLADDQLGNCLNPLDPCNQNGQFTIFPILNVTKSLCDNLGGRFEIDEYPLPICYLDPSSSSSRSSSSVSSSSRSSSSRSSSSVSSSSRSSSSRSSSSVSSSSVSSSCACDPNVPITFDGCDPCCGITQPESGPQFETITTGNGVKICCDPCPNGLYRDANQENCECYSLSSSSRSSSSVSSSSRSSSSRSSSSVSSSSVSSSSRSSSSRSSSSVSSSSVSSSLSSSSNPCPFGINSALLGGGCKDGICGPGTALTYGSICQLYDRLIGDSCIERFFRFDNFELKGLACKQAGDPRCCTTEGGCLFASISYDVEPIEFGASPGGGRGWNVMDIYEYLHTNCDTLAWNRVNGHLPNHKTCGQLKAELFQKFQNLKVSMVNMQMAIADGIGMQKLDDIDINFIPLNRKVRRSIIIDIRDKGNGQNICGSPTAASLTLKCGAGYNFTTIGIAGTQTSGCDCPSCCKQDGVLLGGLPSCSSSSNSSISSSSSCLVVFLDCLPNGYKVCPQTLIPRCSDTDIPPCYCVPCGYPTSCPAGSYLATVGTDINGCTVRVCRPCGYPTSCPAGYTLRAIGTDANGCTIRECKPDRSFSTNTVISKILNIYKTKL